MQREEPVTLELTFECPNKHQVKALISHIQSYGASRLIDKQEFDLHCSHCDWRGKRSGSSRISLRRVE